VCNNPACECMEGESEAGVAVKACANCGARYCSRACQEAAWKQHRPACKWLRKSAE
jgi:hypothetical protein